MKLGQKSAQFILALGLFGCLPAWSVGVNPQSRYTELIERARQGDFGDALAYFQQQAVRNQLSNAQIGDWILISNWAGDDALTLQVYQRYRQTAPISADALAAVARAYRNLHYWDLSISLFEAAIAREPGRIDWHTQLAYVLAEAGYASQAKEQVKRMEAQFSGMHREVAATRFWVLEKIGEPFEALDGASRWVGAMPNDKEAQATYVLALQAAGLPSQALEYLERHEITWFDAAHHRDIQADYGAELVRLSLVPSRSYSERHAIAQRALKWYDSLLSEWSGLPDSEGVRNQVCRIRIDRLGALLANQQAQLLLDEHARLTQTGIQLPDYAWQWVAGAYMELRQPEHAQDIYAGLLERGQLADEHGNLKSGLFYALVDGESLGQARNFVRNWYEQTPMMQGVDGSPTPVPNSEWAWAKGEVALAAYFDGKLADSQRKLEDILALGSADTNARLNLANVYQARGWPRRAAEEQKIVEALQPVSMGLLLGQAYSAEALQDWAEYDALVDHAVHLYSGEARVKRLQRQREVSQKPEVSLQASYEDSDAMSVTANDSVETRINAYSSPLKNNWRIFAGAGYSRAKFVEGKANYRLVNAGLEWRAGDWRGEAVLNHQSVQRRRWTGLGMQLSKSLNDHWTVGAGIAFNSSEAPLRAMRAGISADTANLNLSWRAHESRSLAAQLDGMRLSDGNDRYSLTLNGRQRLYSSGHWNIDAGVEFYTSHNSQPGGPYFAPRNDWSIMPTIGFDHIIYRRYERVWAHELKAGVGHYDQSDYGTGAMHYLSYGQRLQWSDLTDAGISVTYLRRPYDGEQERSVRIGFDMRHRF